MKLNSFYITMLITAIIFAMVYTKATASPVALAAVSARNVYIDMPQDPGFLPDRNHLRATAHAKNVLQFCSEADILAAKWKTKDKIAYLLILAEACRDLTSIDFGINEAIHCQNLTTNYALEALNDKNIMPLAMQEYFTEHLSYIRASTVRPSNVENWVEERTKKTTYYLDTWESLQITANPTPAPDIRMPTLSQKDRDGVPMMDGYYVPKYIKNPDVRARYIAAWVQYRKNQQIVMNANDAKDVETRFVPLAEQYISTAYSRNPVDVAGLKVLLDNYGIDKADENAIIGKISVNPDAGH